MSGIVGMLALKGARPDQNVLERMLDTIRHRGPDGSGVAINGPCGLGRTCLKSNPACDSSPEPLHITYTTPYTEGSQTGDAWIAHSGQAYNYREIKAALQATGHQFQTDTDAETLLRSYTQFGVQNFIKAFRGTFASAIWDASRQQLLLLRDRLGQIPLFYYQDTQWLIFASEIKALLAHPGVSKRFNSSMVPHYLAHGYPPLPGTMFEGIMALKPGSMLTVDLSQQPLQFHTSVYWRPPYSIAKNVVSEQNLTDDLLAHLKGAVRLRIQSEEAPVGAFLSGGLDSAAVVALLVQETNQRIQTFSISLAGGSDFDDRRFARQISARFVTEHHDLVMEPDVLSLAQTLVQHYDHPFGDVAALPIYLLGQHVPADVRVVFSGDGGDELFAGYEQFRLARLAGSYSQLPQVAHRAIGSVLERLPDASALNDFMQQANRVMRAADLPLSEWYLSWVRYVPELWLTALMGGQRERAVVDAFNALFDAQAGGQTRDIIARLLDVNLRSYLPGGLLVRIDRCSKAASLDVRTPFLDHQLVHFVSTIPSSLKLRRRTSKYILKQALSDLLPERIVERKPQNPTVPVDTWFRGKLAGPARALMLGEDAVVRHIFDMEALRAMFDTHTAGEVELGHALWAIFTLELWLRHHFN